MYEANKHELKLKYIEVDIGKAERIYIPISGSIVATKI